MHKKIRQAMEAKCVTQTELAEAAGVSQAFMSYVLHGYKLPSVPVLKRIADKLEVPVDELLK